MPSLPPHLLRDLSPSAPSSLKSRVDLTSFDFPSSPDVKITQKESDDFDEMFKNLPEDSKKKLDKLQKKYGLTRNQLILAGLKKWAPGYVGTFKMAMFFGIVVVDGWSQMVSNVPSREKLKETFIQDQILQFILFLSDTEFPKYLLKDSKGNMIGCGYLYQEYRNRRESMDILQHMKRVGETSNPKDNYERGYIITA